MKIIIIGAGKVGFTLAERLVRENHDIILIDVDPLALSHAEGSLDVMCIKGNGANYAVLEDAGAEDAELVIAVAESDELNMICCLLAKKMGAKQTIARIRNPEYEYEHDMLISGLGLDSVINPEHAAAEEIALLLRFPWATSVDTFTRGKVALVGMRVTQGDSFAGRSVIDIAKKISARVLFCTIERGDAVFIPSGDTVLQTGDKLHVAGETNDLVQLSKMINKNYQKIQKVIVIGGGHIAYYLTNMITQAGLQVKIIEKDGERAEELSNALPNALIINADGTEQDILEAENIRNTDAFVAITGRDEENLLNALFAMSCGVPKVITKINRSNYTEMLKTLGIDTVITPRQITANHILRHVRATENAKGSFVETLYRISGGRVEALEFSANHVRQMHGVPLKDLKLRRGVLIAAIVRGHKIVIPRGNDAVNEGDRVIVISMNEKLTDLNDILE